MRDFLIVGRGLAAWTLAHTLAEHKKSFTVIGDSSLSRSSYVAAGIWNPVVFKRMTASWMAEQLIPEMLRFYNGCETTLATKLVYKKNILKPFIEEQEKKLWLKKSKNDLAGFLSDDIRAQLPEGMKYCKVSGEYGTVLNAGNIDLPEFLQKSELHFSDMIIGERFAHDQLEILNGYVSYKNVPAGSVIFCEGHLVSENPFFNWLPVKPAKGEVLTLKSEADPGNNIFNRDGFIFKTVSGNLKAGATYDWTDFTDNPTAKGLQQLTAKLDKLIDASYELIRHEAGVRPSSSDRRPLIGRHPEHSQLFVFNGLGTKGVMLAPYFANNFVHFCLEKQELNPEADIKRFYSLYKGAR